MSIKASSEDLLENAYEQQVLEADMLGNALLANTLSDKVTETKRRVANKLNTIISDYRAYKAELDKLQSLKVVNVYKILKINEENNLLDKIYAAEKLLKKIEDILNSYVKYNAVGLVSREEYVQLKNHINIVQSMKMEVKDLPKNAESKYHKIEEFNKNLKKIIEFIESTTAKLSEGQIAVIKDSSDALN